MMQNYRAPCYTLTETMEILGLRHSELHNEIRKGNLKAVVYCKQKSMLMFRNDNNGKLLGHAVCRYMGHMVPNTRVITTLLDGESYLLETSGARLLDQDGVIGWSTDYPFKNKLPHDPIVDWIPIDLIRDSNQENRPIGQTQAIAQNSINNPNRPIGQNSATNNFRPIGQDQPIAHLGYFGATPFPNEFEPLHKTLKPLMDQLAAAFPEVNRLNQKNAQVEKVPLNDYALDFKKNSKLNPEDLRIPASEIDRYKEQLIKEDKANRIAEVMTPIASKTQRKRQNQMYEIIERILGKKQDISAKDAWQIIQKDSEKEDRLFDLDNILGVVDADCIEWTSRNGVNNSMSWDSFQAILSKLKKNAAKS